MLASASVLLSLIAVAQAATKSMTLAITNADQSVDGKSKQSITINGGFGPLISANINDNFAINIRNTLQNKVMLKSTTVHWHGLHMKGTAQADGNAFVTQCPIITGSSYTYNFKSDGQSGTYWYHSHYSAQYCDGLRGPLIIYDSQDPGRFGGYDVDDSSTVITLADWYSAPLNSIYQPGQSAPPPEPVMQLINNKGRASSSSKAELSVFNVQKGKKYRYRVISMSCDPEYTFSINNHKLTVIEADGILHKPVTVDSIRLVAGQRYSFILSADQAVGNYWIRSLPSLGPSSFEGGQNSAILRYQGAASAEPSGTSQNLGTGLTESSLVPFFNPGAPGGSNQADIKLNLQLSIGQGGFYVNGVHYVSPTVPVLLQILSGTTDPNLVPKGSIYSLPRDKVVEISIPSNQAAPPHPFHLHGHSFDVVRSAGQNNYNYVNPPRRDVVDTGRAAGSNVTFRFKTDNPGPWMLHCHIDSHLASGMAIVFAEDSSSVKSAYPSDTGKAVCDAFNAQPADDR